MELPVTCKVEDANKLPEEFKYKRLDALESWIWKIFTNCPEALRIESGTAPEEDASIVTTEFPIGVVVPKDDGVDVPLTAPASWAKTAEAICWRGDNFSNPESVEETSTWR